MDSTRNGKITVLVGGQYGSEGKGAVAAHIATNYDVHVRVGSHNAGHTFYWNGAKHVQQVIPCGWINPNALIVIGRGAIVPVDGLIEEVEHIKKYYPNFLGRLAIDPEAGILDKEYAATEGGKDGWFNRQIGSTGEGCGEARVARIRRDPNVFTRFKDAFNDPRYEEKLRPFRSCLLEDTPQHLLSMKHNGASILIEGTQGSDLSLLHSHWPYCTSIDTNAAGIIAEVGISPLEVTDVLMVCRTYPIRVAGNSGPMAQEITWEELSDRIGKNVVPEKTTVTKKVRRIAEWDDEQFDRAFTLNTPTSIAIMFADYVDPSVAGKRGTLRLSEIGSNFVRWVNSKDSRILPRLDYVGTGPDSIVDVDKSGLNSSRWEG